MHGFHITLNYMTYFFSISEKTHHTSFPQAWLTDSVTLVVTCTICVGIQVSRYILWFYRGCGVFN